MGQVGNDSFGTFLEKTLQEGKRCILRKLKVQGAIQVKKAFPEKVYFIFLAPPSLSELKNRIVGRGTETEDVIENRLTVAKEEIDMMDAYDYVVEKRPS